MSESEQGTGVPGAGEVARETVEEVSRSTRRSFLQKAALAGVGAVGFGGLLGAITTEAKVASRSGGDEHGGRDWDRFDDEHEGKRRDTNILLAAKLRKRSQ